MMRKITKQLQTKTLDDDENNKYGKKITLWMMRKITKNLENKSLHNNENN